VFKEFVKSKSYISRDRLLGYLKDYCFLLFINGFLLTYWRLGGRGYVKLKLLNQVQPSIVIVDMITLWNKSSLSGILTANQMSLIEEILSRKR
jgi:hypothetical protein